MQDVIGYEDACIGVTCLSDDTFYFVTFSGIGYTIQICRNSVICLKKKITK